MRRPMSIVAAAVIVVGLVACGGDDDDPKKPESVPADAAAVVGDAEIPKAQLEERVAALRRSQPGRREAKQSPQQTRQTDEQLETQALSMLLYSTALEQEAADRGVEVTDAEVRKRWSSAVEGQFRTKKALRRFLGGQTQGDVLDQLRLQFLAEKIHEQVAEEAGGGKQGAKAVQEFQESFRKEWQERAACGEGYEAAGCSEAPE